MITRLVRTRGNPFTAVLFVVFYLSIASGNHVTAQSCNSGVPCNEDTRPTRQPRTSVKEDPINTKTGFSIPDNDKLRVRVKFMAAWGHDSAQASLGLEKQGRIGYAIVELFGNINKHLSYVLEINPVTETKALAACGEEHFFFPNGPSTIGPRVNCDPDGRTRVDDYRFIAFDLVDQQGAIRQAHLNYQRGKFGVKFGRFMLPIGFHWEDAGSFTSKDATHIQRINAETNFGVDLSFTHARKGQYPSVIINFATFLGEGNRRSDYDYFYFLNPDLDTNSAVTGLLSGTFMPYQQLEFRAALKRGFTGSKVERLPNYFASKRHDSALVLSARYQPFTYVTAFGEWANYTWGPTQTSAKMLGFTTDPIEKSGYYAGVDVSAPVTDALTVGMVVTREELSRDDSLIKFLAEQDRLRVSMGKTERSTVFRWYAQFANSVTLAFYRNLLSNPFPWVSGIHPISGPRAFTGRRGSDKWGFVVRFQVP